MTGPSASNQSRRAKWRAWLPAIGLGLLLALPSTPVAAAGVTSTWQAKVGARGANGTATIRALSTGTGSLALKLVKLKPSASLPVVLSKGTCGSVGAAVVTLPSVRSSSGGAVTKTISLTAPQVTKVRAATKGTGKLAIRVGSGTNRKCGAFALVTPPVVVPTVVATIPVGVVPTGVATDPSGIWVTNWYDQSVSRIDPKTNAVLAVIPLPVGNSSAPEAVASGFGSIWVAIQSFDLATMTDLPGFVLRLDPATGAVLGAPIPVGRRPVNVTASPEAIWISNYGDNSVTRIDPATGIVAATIQLSGSPMAIASGFGSVWVARVSDGKVDRIDPITNQVTASIQTQQSAFGLAIGAGSVWVTYCGCSDQNGIASRIDPATNTVVAAIPVGVEAGFASFGGGFLWIAVDGDTSVVQLDPITNTVKKRIPVGAESWGITATDHSVWVVHPVASGANELDFKPGTVSRIDF